VTGFATLHDCCTGQAQWPQHESICAQHAGSAQEVSLTNGA
jgi:hypothetical protein